jgi:UDP-N-acetyl-D-glucosamine dehydrogenase
MPFYPGPGLGGHCIPVDPHYLVWKMKLMNYNARFIQLADEINSSMPHLVVEKIAAALNDRRKPVKESKILVLGVAYKKDIDDCRESPALDVIKLLQERGAHVSYHDPFVPSITVEGRRYESAPGSNLGSYDCVALLTNHSAFDAAKAVAESQLIVDTRNATKGVPDPSDKIVKL